MQERGYAVDHSTVQRWVVHYAPPIEKVFRKTKRKTGDRWRMDETYIKIKGKWRYFYRAVDKEGKTVDFLLTVKRDKKAAKRFFKRRTKPMLDFKSFWSAVATLAGIELWRMLKKGQNKISLPAWQQFYALTLTG